MKPLSVTTHKEITFLDKLGPNGLTIRIDTEDLPLWAFLDKSDAEALIAHLQKVFSLPAGVSPAVDE